MNDITNPAIEDLVTDALAARDEAVAASELADTAAWLAKRIEDEDARHAQFLETTAWAVACEAWLAAADEACARAGGDQRATDAYVTAKIAHEEALRAVREASRTVRGVR